MEVPDYDKIWPIVPDERLDAIVTVAQQVFWGFVINCFPEIETGDYPPDIHIQFTSDCKRAIGWWLCLNHPQIKKGG